MLEECRILYKSVNDSISQINSDNRKAYKDPAICWDTVFDDYEKEDMPKKGDKTLSDQKVKAVVHYILVNFKDRGKVTKAECEEKFGAGTKLFKKYD